MGTKLLIIYEPKGAAREYAELALNIYKGCTHSCVYCYNNGRYGRKGDFFKRANPRKALVNGLVLDCRYLKDKYADDCPEILLTFLGDAYQPAEQTLGHTRLAIRNLISAGLPFTILTKSMLINRDFDMLSRYLKFRAGFSFTTLDLMEAKEWEPGCGNPYDRADILRKFKSHGTKTWVSLEPVMAVESTIRVIRELNQYVDFFWIGALQHMKSPDPIDLVEAHRRIMETLDFHHCKYKFKRSFTDL